MPMRRNKLVFHIAPNINIERKQGKEPSASQTDCASARFHGTLRALPAWNGARTSPEDIRAGEKQKASAQERAAAAAMKQVALMMFLFSWSRC